MLRRSSMSRAELARATGLSRAATSLIAEELLKDGIVMELPPQSVGRGRSATPLAVRADSYYALAVDLARKSCSVGLCDMSGHLLQFRAFPDQDGLLDLIIEALRRMAQSVDKSKILGIGISSPGPLDCEGGKILNPPQFDRWHGVEISAILSQALDLPAYLEHDVCALALHQLEMGHSRNFMLVFVDIGIGAAIMSIIPNQLAYITVLMILLFVVGCLMDTIPSILILAPILVPVGVQFGLDELHLGVLFCITLTVGFITPPFGINLFTAVSTTGESYTSVVKGVIPFMIVMIICVLICAFVAPIITFLPGFMMGT